MQNTTLKLPLITAKVLTKLAILEILSDQWWLALTENKFFSEVIALKKKRQC